MSNDSSWCGLGGLLAKYKWLLILIAIGMLGVLFFQNHHDTSGNYDISGAGMFAGVALGGTYAYKLSKGHSEPTKEGTEEKQPLSANDDLTEMLQDKAEEGVSWGRIALAVLGIAGLVAMGFVGSGIPAIAIYGSLLIGVGAYSFCPEDYVYRRGVDSVCGFVFGTKQTAAPPANPQAGWALPKGNSRRLYEDGVETHEILTAVILSIISFTVFTMLKRRCDKEREVAERCELGAIWA